MFFELWEIVSFGDGDFQPFLLNSRFGDFRDAYLAFQNLIKTTPCCIILSKGDIK
jgi:hypothetical protein